MAASQIVKPFIAAFAAAALLAALPTRAAAAAAPASRPATAPAAARPPARVVFLVDMSGSMNLCWLESITEIAKAIDAMGPQDRFAIVLAGSDGPISLPGGWVVPAEATKMAAWDFLRGHKPQGTNYAFPKAVDVVSRLRPASVTFVSDGTPNEDVEQFAKPLRDAQRAGRFTVSTSLAFATPGDVDAERTLTEIAREFGGRALGVPQKVKLDDKAAQAAMDRVPPVDRPRGASVLTPPTK